MHWTLLLHIHRDNKELCLSTFPDNVYNYTSQAFIQIIHTNHPAEIIWSFVSMHLGPKFSNKN